MIQTKDYGMFKSLKGNREIRSKHLSRLMKSIQRNNLLHLYPILVNEEMEIIDGQHRLLAAEKLDIPIYFVQEAGLEVSDVRDINANQESWKIPDYANSYAKMGKPLYEKISKYYKQFGLAHTTIARIITKGKLSNVEEFKEGAVYPTIDDSLAEKVLKLLVDLRKIEKYLGNKAWAVSIAMLVISKQISPNDILNKFTGYTKHIRNYVSRKDIEFELNKILNFRSRKMKRYTVENSW